MYRLDSRTSFALLCEQGERPPQAVIAIEQGREVLYTTLAHKAETLAHHLANRGVTRGDRIGLLYDNCIE